MRPATAVLVFLSTFLLAGYTVPTRVEVPSPTAEPGFEVTDARPAKQNKSGFESMSIGSCAYGSIRVGGEDMQPQPAVLVRNLLSTRLGGRLDGRRVALLNLTVHVNGAKHYRQGVMDSQPVGPGGQPGLLQEALIAREKVGCAPDDLRGGYVVGEIDSENPLVLVLDVAVDGVEHHARCVRPWPVAGPPTKRSSPEDQARWGAAVADAVSCAADRLAEQIIAGTPVALPRAADGKGRH